MLSLDQGSTLVVKKLAERCRSIVNLYPGSSGCDAGRRWCLPGPTDRPVPSTIFGVLRADDRVACFDYTRRNSSTGTRTVDPSQNDPIVGPRGRVPGSVLGELTVAGPSAQAPPRAACQLGCGEKTRTVARGENSHGLGAASTSTSRRPRTKIKAGSASERSRPVRRSALSWAGKEPALTPTLAPSTTPQRQLDNDPANPCLKRTLAMKLVEFLRTRRQTRLEGCPGHLPAGPRVGSEAGRDGPDSGASEGRMSPSGSLAMLTRGCGRLDTRSSRFETLPPGLKFPQGTTFREHENAAAPQRSIRPQIGTARAIWGSRQGRTEPDPSKARSTFSL